MTTTTFYCALCGWDTVNPLAGEGSFCWECGEIDSMRQEQPVDFLLRELIRAHTECTDPEWARAMDIMEETIREGEPPIIYINKLRDPTDPDFPHNC
jgi:hypothetical protein